MREAEQRRERRAGRRGRARMRRRRRPASRGAPGPEPAAATREARDPVVPVGGHQHAVPNNRHRVRRLELAGAVTRCAEAAQVPAIQPEHHDAVIRPVSTVQLAVGNHRVARPA